MFADKATIWIRSGKGGDGHVSFRRELYVPNGGPDGGDGGQGGDVLFQIDRGMSTLQNYRHKRKYSAKDGEQGGKKRCHGKNGDSIILKVPEGTVIREADTGKVIADMSGPNEKVVVLRGGRGGLGNQHFATATMQIPKYAQPGQPARELNVILELKVIADVGLVGYPNVGKSTLLSRISHANPKIGNYHFTTISPNLGVVDLGEGKGFVVADIPGLIEGASQGLGLGHEFLRHIERTKILIHVIDSASVEGRDPLEDIRKIQTELKTYDIDLSKKPMVIAGNKSDLLDEEAKETLAARIQADSEIFGIPFYFISGVTGQGIGDLLYAVSDILDKMDQEVVIFSQEYFPEEELVYVDLPFSVSVEDGVYVIEGPKIDKMLGYTNLESEKGFAFFQNFLKDTGILKELEDKGIKDGDTVRMYGLQFEYYK